MMHPIRRFSLSAALAAAFLLHAGPGTAATFGPTTGLVPLDDLATGLYLDRYMGGLYPGGTNEMPPAHVLVGLDRAAAVQPLDADGNPSPTGKCVLLSVGMSNTTQEFWGANQLVPPRSWSFAGQAAVHVVVNHAALAIVDGAKGGQTPPYWVPSTAANYDRVRDEQLAPLGLTEKQVQAIWIKQADAAPTVSLPNSNADAFTLERGLGQVVRACKIRYPNLQVIFFSSRIYAGYATSGLNPEPYAYESGFSVKWLIQAQINQMATGHVDSIAGDLNYYNGTAPWLAWGPYLWADGMNARSDGLVWLQTDFDPKDYTHPGTPAETKVGRMLLDFLLASPFSRTWFRGTYVPGDIDGDGHVDVVDLLTFVPCFGMTLGQRGYDPACDLDGNNSADVVDLLTLVGNWDA